MKKIWPLAIKTIFAIVIIAALPYLGYIAWVLGGSTFHQMKWQSKGATSYEIKSDLNDFSPIRGVNILEVKNGEIEKVTVVETQFPGDKHDLQDYEELTIEGMFRKAFDCVSEFPRLICSFEYDSEYGFPTKVNVDCPNPDTCYESYETLDVLYVHFLEK
ncbi:hypothetical protein EHM76_07035 [bacterium]|nr:MAG: hypothetical protein EHM76_07035 [bacterium]